jgi:hypothetical protein
MTHKPTPLSELARGTDFGRRLARVEEQIGIGRPKWHLGLTRDGLVHIGAGPFCRQLCPPVDHRTVERVNAYTTIVNDTRPAVILDAEAMAERKQRLGYQPLPPLSPASVKPAVDG